MSEVKERVQKELNDLQTKRAKLKNFIYSDKFHELNKAQQYLLTLQNHYMVEYADVLEARLSIME